LEDFLCVFSLLVQHGKEKFFRSYGGSAEGMMERADDSLHSLFSPLQLSKTLILSSSSSSSLSARSFCNVMLKMMGEKEAPQN